MNKFQRASTATHTAPSFRRPALFGLAILMVGGLMVSGCNTTAGAGQDIKAGGSAITRSADEVKAKL